MRQSVEILGADMNAGLVSALLAECLKCLKDKADWNMRKQAAETLAALAASNQVSPDWASDKGGLTISLLVPIAFSGLPLSIHVGACWSIFWVLRRLLAPASAGLQAERC
jgi:hypothetical protein